MVSFGGVEPVDDGQSIGLYFEDLFLFTIEVIIDDGAVENIDGFEGIGFAGIFGDQWIMKCYSFWILFYFLD